MRSSDFPSVVSPLSMGTRKKKPSAIRAGVKRPRPRMPRMSAPSAVGALSQSRMKRKLAPPTPGALGARRTR